MTEQSTLFIADTHVHVYPCYDLERFYLSATRNLAQLKSKLRDPGALGVLFLTERSDCNYFQELRDGKSASLPAGWSREALSEKVVRVHSGATELLLVAGRQIITAERLEVLALNSVERYADGLPIDEVLAKTQSAALTVLNWSLGKWMCKRGKVIERVLTAADPRDTVIGDVRARPLGWGTPRLIDLAARRGFEIIAGSDPLPVSGDEIYAGSYASTFSLAGSDARSRIGDAAREQIRAGTFRSKIVGSRGGPWETALRLRANSASKRAN